MTGVFFITFLAGALITVLVGIFFIDVAIFFPRYFELSKARRGMKTILTNKIPSPNVQCFQKFSVILK